MRKVLAIPDLHAPFTDMEALAFYYALARTIQPDLVIQLGDAYDCYSFSKFPINPNLMTPKQELTEGYRMLAAFWQQIQQAAPNAECMQLTGNHEARISKRILETTPAALDLLNIGHLYDFDGVGVVRDPRKETEIDGVLYIHGFLSTPLKHLAFFNQSVVHGHTHRMSVDCRPNRYKMLFAAECGHAGDRSLIPMQYTGTAHTHWTTGAMLISEHGPHPMMLPKK